MDWTAIKMEYVTTGASYRDLAAKYGVTYTVIARKGKADGWVDLRNQYVAKTQSDISDASRTMEVARATKFHAVADKLLGEIEALMDDSGPMDAKSIRTLAAALKDLKEVRGVMTDLDRQEQEARIANLRKQADKIDGNDGANITVQMIGGLEDYAQ